VIRLVIADDHVIVRDGLKLIVAQSHDIKVVGEAGDAATTLEVCAALKPDVLLLDVSMPGPGILELIPQLKALQAGLHVLVLSVHPEEHYGKRVLKAGADGYLTKNHSSQALSSAIRQVNSGRKYLTPSLAEQLAVDLSRTSDEGSPEALSNREYEVLLQLGAGKSVVQVARELALSPKTVRTYRGRILDKLNLKSTAELIFYAVNHQIVEPVIAPMKPDRPAKRRS